MNTGSSRGSDKFLFVEFVSDYSNRCRVYVGIGREEPLDEGGYELILIVGALNVFQVSDRALHLPECSERCVTKEPGHHSFFLTEKRRGGEDKLHLYQSTERLHGHVDE